ncbi:MAG: DUF386 domain-containing protein [Anaerolineales bacterium]|nr:DUF386 domain-containing protein [Anaerolineales bacterium]
MVCDLWTRWPRARLRAGAEELEQFLADIRAHGEPSDGRYPIRGDDIYAQVARYVTCAAPSSTLEAHRTYADIQCLLSGRECIEWHTCDGLGIATQYDEAQDVVRLSRPSDGCSTLLLRPGLFALFMPWDAHQPQVAVPAGPAPVTKLVVKIKAHLLAVG